MKRGDLITVALQGELGKPRPALVIQSDLFNEHPSVVVLPITSDLREGLFFRVDVQPNPFNGLQKPSQIMVDKIITVSTGKVGQVFGTIEFETLMTVNRVMAVFLGLV
jgi:mRNA interferase MazF